MLLRLLALLLLCLSSGMAASLGHSRQDLEEAEDTLAVTEEPQVAGAPEGLVADSPAAEEPLLPDSPAPAEEHLVAESLAAAEEPLVADSPVVEAPAEDSPAMADPVEEAPVVADSHDADTPPSPAIAEDTLVETAVDSPAEDALQDDAPAAQPEDTDAPTESADVASDPVIDGPAGEAAAGEAAEMDAPADTPAAVDTPAGDEAHGDTPVDGGIAADAPVDGEMAADAPVDGEVAADAPVDGEMAADAPVDGEMPADAPVDGEMAADAPVDGEMLADAPVDGEMVADDDAAADLLDNLIPEEEEDEDIMAPLPSSLQNNADDSWTMNSIRSSFQAVNSYFDSVVEMMGGRNGVCQYRCRYGKTPTPRPGYVIPEPNGCSSNMLGFEFDLGIPAMTKCCNQLDVCYDSCGSNKNRCDSKFRWCLHGICSELKKSLGFVSKVEVCESMADAMYNTVWTLGCRSYMSSQRAACVCEGEERDEL